MNNEFKIDTFKPVKLINVNKRLEGAIEKRIEQIEKNAKRIHNKNLTLFGKFKNLLHFN